MTEEDKQIFINRFNNLSMIHGVFKSLNLDIQNSALELNRLLDAEDEATLIIYENENNRLVGIENARKNKSDLIKTGEQIRGLCNRILSLITGYNYTRSLTAEQVNTLKTTFSEINEYLKDGQPFSAKPLIEQITPDGVLITEEIKQSILSEFVL